MLINFIKEKNLEGGLIMNKRKSSKKNHLTDIDIELYCKGVEGVLTQIRDRCSHKKANKTKKEKRLPEEELLTYT
jgi:hypothetical protein